MCVCVNTRGMKKARTIESHDKSFECRQLVGTNDNDKAWQQGYMEIPMCNMSMVLYELLVTCSV